MFNNAGGARSLARCGPGRDRYQVRQATNGISAEMSSECGKSRFDWKFECIFARLITGFVVRCDTEAPGAAVHGTARANLIGFRAISCILLITTVSCAHLVTAPSKKPTRNPHQAQLTQHLLADSTLENYIKFADVSGGYA